MNRIAHLLGTAMPKHSKEQNGRATDLPLRRSPYAPLTGDHEAIAAIIEARILRRYPSVAAFFRSARTGSGSDSWFQNLKIGKVQTRTRTFNHVARAIGLDAEALADGREVEAVAPATDPDADWRFVRTTASGPAIEALVRRAAELERRDGHSGSP